MTISQIAKRVDELGSSWEQFKDVNNRRLHEVEKKGSADSITLDHLNRINNAIDECKERVVQVETTMLRPDMSAGYTSPTNNEYKEAFCNYLRKGKEDALISMEKKALSVGSDPEGGYLVTPHVSENIIRTVFETSPIRQISAVEVISSDSLEILEDNNEAGSGWTSEIAAVTETTTPDIGKKIIPVHELYAQPKATQKLIDDANIDIELWLSGKLTEVFSRKENTAFVNGDGIGKPRGVLTYATGTSWGQIEQINSGTSGNVTADSIITLFYSLKEEYAAHSTFIMNRSTAQQVRLLKETTTGQYLWNPGLTAGAPDTLLGVPVKQAADMPVPAANSLSIAVGDFGRGYQIVDRAGIRILRDPYTEKPFVKFYATKRTGGDVANFEAIKILKLAV